MEKSTAKEVEEGGSIDVNPRSLERRWVGTRSIGGSATAPTILFAYRVWGSTRIGPRWREVQEDTPAEQSSETRQIMSEIALGLRRGSGLSAWDKA
jgi:hypothetical protein